MSTIDEKLKEIEKENAHVAACLDHDGYDCEGSVGNLSHNTVPRLIAMLRKCLKQRDDAYFHAQETPYNEWLKKRDAELLKLAGE